MSIHDVYITCRNETSFLNFLNPQFLWHDLNTSNLWTFFITFAVVFFTPLWSTLLFYLHFPVLVVYYTSRFVGKRFGYKVSDDPMRQMRHFFGHVWQFVAKHWHGYSVVGEENIPKKGPAIFVAYHGAFGLDLYYFCSAYMVKEKGKVIRPVAHRKFEKLTGWNLFVKVVNVVSSSQESCVKSLKEGSLILVAPGGSHEALYSDQTTYKLLWKKKNGFARVALEGKAAVIPIFTVNIRESYRIPVALKPMFAFLQRKIGLPIPLAFGGFPVKLTTHVGKPIPYDKNLTPDELADKTAQALEDLIRKNQRIPGCIWSAMVDRFSSNKSAEN